MMYGDCSVEHDVRAKAGGTERENDTGECSVRKKETHHENTRTQYTGAKASDATRKDKYAGMGRASKRMCIEWRENNDCIEVALLRTLGR